MVLSHVPSAACIAEGSSEVSGLRHCSAHLKYPSEGKPGRTESVLVRVSIAVMKHHDHNVHRGGKGLFSSHVHIDVDHRRKLGQELKHTGTWGQEGADAEATEGFCLLTCLASDISPRVTTPAMDWVLPHQSLIMSYSQIL